MAVSSRSETILLEIPLRLLGSVCTSKRTREPSALASANISLAWCLASHPFSDVDEEGPTCGLPTVKPSIMAALLPVARSSQSHPLLGPTRASHFSSNLSRNPKREKRSLISALWSLRYFDARRSYRHPGKFMFNRLKSRNVWIFNIFNHINSNNWNLFINSFTPIRHFLTPKILKKLSFEFKSLITNLNSKLRNSKLPIQYDRRKFKTFLNFDQTNSNNLDFGLNIYTLIWFDSNAISDILILNMFIAYRRFFLFTIFFLIFQN